MTQHHLLVFHCVGWGLYSFQRWLLLGNTPTRRSQAITRRYMLYQCLGMYWLTLPSCPHFKYCTYLHTIKYTSNCHFSSSGQLILTLRELYPNTKQPFWHDSSEETLSMSQVGFSITSRGLNWHGRRQTCAHNWNTRTRYLQCQPLPVGGSAKSTLRIWEHHL